MWRPQFTRESIGFGLGFQVGTFRQRLTIGHNGAVYGCSSSFVVLPEEKLAVVVLANEDIVNGRVHCISDAALSLMLEAKLREGAAPKATSLGTRNLAQFAGLYESESYWARLAVRNHKLVANISGQPTRLVPVGASRFVANSRIDDATPVVFTQDDRGKIRGFEMGIQHFERVRRHRQPRTKAWDAFCGSYGRPFIPLVISERYGHLYATTENMVDYRLTPIDANVFLLPAGLYAEERVEFLQEASAPSYAVRFAGITLPRLA